MTQFKKLKAAVAWQVCREFGLTQESEARQLAGGKAAVDQYLEHLTKAGRRQEALEFLAYSLPKREAAWWACLATRAVIGEAPAAADLAALEAADAWVYKPSEENRRKAMDLGEAADKGAPSTWAALAAGWSGGSLAPAGQPEVAPPSHLTGKAVTVAHTLAAHGGKPAEAPARQGLFLAQGLDLARGGNGRVDAQGRRVKGVGDARAL